MRSSTSMNQQTNNLQNSQLKKSTAAVEDDQQYFDRNIRQYYELCENCPMNKQLNHVCISPKCPYYFKLVCPFCHKQNHLVDPIMTYQIQDVDLFMQEIVKITRQKKNIAKKQREKNKLYDVIDEKIKQIDNLIQAIGSIKNVLEYKKVVLGQVFREYDLVYEELLKIYKPSNHYSSINKTLDFLNKMFHYQKGTGSNRQWSLQWKNEAFIQENFIKPLEEIDLHKNIGQNSQKKLGQMNTISESKNEDKGSNESRENIESQNENNQKFQQKFNQAIESIENTLNQLTNYTNNFLRSQDFVYLSSAGTVEDHIKDEKQKCLTECNKILKEHDIHFQVIYSKSQIIQRQIYIYYLKQWETFVTIQNYKLNGNKNLNLFYNRNKLQIFLLVINSFTIFYIQKVIQRDKCKLKDRFNILGYQKVKQITNKKYRQQEIIIFKQIFLNAFKNKQINKQSVNQFRIKIFNFLINLQKRRQNEY
ncbi:hypothetical protein TTHERM_00494010 (macronuclear) [Tetrahymena thermophila SB210]|uniref:Uncharacterized protein n=1 Tax=Tetrahymena thermophila (strain SB210) TaxID=312017 RepID=I7MHG3_TETTS|nr:hypothetical protein TTHERM_00494010 [Tetrahymena thermophila SB210]EAS02949.2 hypothetical protein TTHERM_00494010 [Tetrahymena thermophila SB210]|eukprot:XP_001023194.2 hypothetical protein TTHERM_00494010 [Tetrahymena thermophila SB210]